MSPFCRHDLLEISDEGRQAAFDLVSRNAGQEHLDLIRQIIVGEEGIARIPGIARREDDNQIPGLIPVGFASPGHIDGNRLRVAAFVPPESVQAQITPYHILNRPFIRRTPCLKALAAIAVVAGELKLEMGVWGSAALEIFTGLTYTHENSDLDLLLKLAPLEVMQAFLEKAVGTAGHYGCRADVEVSLPSGYGVKLQELVADTHTVLAKGLNDVVLLEKKDLLAIMKNFSNPFIASYENENKLEG